MEAEKLELSSRYVRLEVENKKLVQANENFAITNEALANSFHECFWNGAVEEAWVDEEAIAGLEFADGGGGNVARIGDDGDIVAEIRAIGEVIDIQKCAHVDNVFDGGQVAAEEAQACEEAIARLKSAGGCSKNRGCQRWCGGHWSHWGSYEYIEACFY
ncbi:hypothetical protein QYF36_021269 [Acer negundo]|nr:hypothetical protein QYF36_021269 [Acer negundo]